MAHKFLHSLAERIWIDHTTHPLHEQLIILPTKRACLFFQRSLLDLLEGQAMILPAIVTIDEWISTMSERVVADSMTLTSYLYQLYTEYWSEQQDLRNGQSSDCESSDPLLHLSQVERMLSDFQDIDLALADIDKLLLNIEQLEEYDDFAFLSEEQRSAILKFWRDLDPKKLTEGSFLTHATTWLTLYHRLNLRLEEEGLTYRAAAYRIVGAIDGISPDDLLWRMKRHYGSHLSRVTIAGLYNLTPAEIQCIKKLTTASLRDIDLKIYWEKIALQGIEEPLNNTLSYNIKLLGGEILNDRQSSPTPRVSLVHVNSTILQPQIVNQLLRNILHKDPTAIEELRIAIILNKEETLIPLLNSLSLPPELQSINITMGYPITHSAVATWIRRYISCYTVSYPKKDGCLSLPTQRLTGWLLAPITQQLFGEATQTIAQELAFYPYSIYTDELQEILQQKIQADNPLARSLSIKTSGEALLDQLGVLLQMLLNKHDPSQTRVEEREENIDIERPKEVEPKPEERLEIEFIDHLLRALGKLQMVIQMDQRLNTISHTTYLLEQLISVGSIPFEGAPLEGLQVMGFLETRALHFDYLLMLNVQEGALPKTKKSTTLIPDLLRSAYGLTIYRTEEQTNAYHFYRLFNEARHIYLLQDVRLKSLSPIEHSRYLDQIRYLTKLKLESLSFSYKISSPHSPLILPTLSSPEVAAFIEEISHEDPLGEHHRSFSPSDLITYYKCPLQLYFKQIRQVGEPPQEPRVLDASRMGSIVHSALNQLYQKHTTLTTDLLSSILEQRSQYRSLLHQAYVQELSLRDNGGAIDTLQELDLVRMVERAIHIDHKLLSEGYQIELIDCEYRIDRIPIPLVQVKKCIYSKGFIDRIDLLTDPEGYQVLRIVDYKTGAIDKKDPKRQFSTELLDDWRTDYTKARIGGYFLQLLLYSWMYILHNQRKSNNLAIQPTLYSLAHKIPLAKASIDYGNFNLNEIQELVSHYLNTLFIPESSYLQAPLGNQLCSHCLYRSICGR